MAKYTEYTTFVQLPGVTQTIHLIKTLSYVIFLLLFVTKILSKKVNIVYILIISILLMYFGYQAVINKRADIFGVILCGLCFDGDHAYNTLKHIYRTSCVMYIITAVCSLLGIIQNVSAEFAKLGIVSTRYSLGFTYPGQMIMMLFPIVLMHFYLRSGKVNKKDIALWTLITIFAFLICKTIMGTLLILIYLFIISLPNRKIIKNKKFVEKIPVICWLITGALLLWENAGGIIINIIDSIVNHRLNLGITFIKAYGITLFGTGFTNAGSVGIEMGSSGYFYQYLDSEYMYTLVACGIIYAVLSIVLLVTLMRYVAHKGNYYLLISWTLLLINGIVNNGIFNITMNPFVISLCASILWNVSSYGGIHERTISCNYIS